MPDVATLESTTSCLVCNRPLSVLDRRQNIKLCSVRCRAEYSRFLPGQTCGYCGRPLRPAELAAKLCEGTDCRLKSAEKQVREQERLEREERDAAARIIHEKAVGNESADYPLTIIPSNALRIVDLDIERRQALSDHIESILNAMNVVDGTEPVPGPLPTLVPPSPELLKLLAGACSLCRGDCCRRGGERAYIDTQTIRRYQCDHPESTPREILAAYLGRVGTRVYAGSCIYHQPDGCALPRDMRSDTCNRYYCPELKAFQQDASEWKTDRAFFAAGSLGVVRAAGFVDQDGVRPVSVAIEDLR